MPKISVIIPNFNQSHYVGNSIRSVLNQTWQDFEIIVVDDGSTDDSREVVSQFGEKARYIWQKNQGLAGARNTGIQAAAGELIGLLDADDEWAPGYLEEMTRLAGENPGALVFYAMARCMDADGGDLPQHVGGPPVEPNALYCKLLRANFIIPSTVIFRKEPIVEAGSFDASLRSCEDWDLWLRLLPEKKIVGTSKVLVRYRVHGSSLSTNVQGMHDAARKVVEKHFDQDDGDPSTWSEEKRRAYGGLYRYEAITFVQRENNWNEAARSLSRALIADPSLSTDLDFFYELGLGGRAVGYRGVSGMDEMESTTIQLKRMIQSAFEESKIKLLCDKTIGTSEYALGLITYGSERRKASRGHFARALSHRPELILDFRLLGSFLKSFLGASGVKSIKKLLGHTP